MDTSEGDPMTLVAEPVVTGDGRKVFKVGETGLGNGVGAKDLGENRYGDVDKIEMTIDQLVSSRRKVQSEMDAMLDELGIEGGQQPQFWSFLIDEAGEVDFDEDFFDSLDGDGIDLASEAQRHNLWVKVKGLVKELPLSRDKGLVKLAKNYEDDELRLVVEALTFTGEEDPMKAKILLAQEKLAEVFMKEGEKADLLLFRAGLSMKEQGSSLEEIDYRLLGLPREKDKRAMELIQDFEQKGDDLTLVRIALGRGASEGEIEVAMELMDELLVTHGDDPRLIGLKQTLLEAEQDRVRFENNGITEFFKDKPEELKAMFGQVKEVLKGVITNEDFKDKIKTALMVSAVLVVVILLVGGAAMGKVLKQG